MSLRYSIYKVQTLLFALADSFCILSHSVSFVKNFFQVFANFSESFLLVALASNFAMLAYPLIFVKYFFQVFANFFRIRYCFGCLATALIYYHTLKHLSRVFFKFFEDFRIFFNFVYTLNFFEVQLTFRKDYIPFYPSCQHLFYQNIAL